MATEITFADDYKTKSVRLRLTSLSKVSTVCVDRVVPEIPSRFTATPSEDQARLEVTTIDFGKSNQGYLIFNIYYANQGALPSQGLLRKYAVGASPIELSQSDANGMQAQNSVFTKAELVGLETDYRESYRNSPSREFFSVPGHPGEDADTVAKSADDVLAGKAYLYLFLTLAYRDRSMPKGVYGATETCVYFIRSFDVWHSCGNRYILRQLNDPQYSRALKVTR